MYDRKVYKYRWYIKVHTEINMEYLFFSKPKFLDSHVSRIEVGWDDTKDKASARLTLLQNTKDAWVGYAEGLETIAVEFEKGDEEIKKVKKQLFVSQ